jgi:signal transduction histidine kinase
LVRTDWFVNGCLTPIEASAKNKNIIIEKILPEIFPTLIADKELLKGAIINLLGNALKYTPESGKVTFSITEQDKNVVFEVMDTGYGIAREDIPRIFDKFYRSSNPYITRQTGSGLGLAITSDIVHLHDGTIEVESQLGEGSHFTIKIPKEEYQIGKG